jgi:hypothetical protein
MKIHQRVECSGSIIARSTVDIWSQWDRIVRGVVSTKTGQPIEGLPEKIARDTRGAEGTTRQVQCLHPQTSRSMFEVWMLAASQDQTEGHLVSHRKMVKWQLTNVT